MLLPFARAHLGTTLLRPPRLALQLARSICQVLAVSLFFSTLSYLPLADTLAICFLYPLITVALAATAARRESSARVAGSPSWRGLSAPSSSSGLASACSSRRPCWAC